jgi:hypothetical protein
MGKEAEADPSHLLAFHKRFQEMAASAKIGPVASNVNS